MLRVLQGGPIVVHGSNPSLLRGSLGGSGTGRVRGTEELRGGGGDVPAVDTTSGLDFDLPFY